MADLAERFYERFQGLDRVHGLYNVIGKKPPKGTKWKGKAPQTKMEGPSPKLWDKHFRGEIGIGIVPIRDDDTVRWGAIDIDDYHISLKKLSAKFSVGKISLQKWFGISSWNGRSSWAILAWKSSQSKYGWLVTKI
jgi:hypothetical protein